MLPPSPSSVYHSIHEMSTTIQPKKTVPSVCMYMLTFVFGVCKSRFVSNFLILWLDCVGVSETIDAGGWCDGRLVSWLVGWLFVWLVVRVVLVSVVECFFVLCFVARSMMIVWAHEQTGLPDLVGTRSRLAIISFRKKEQETQTQKTNTHIAYARSTHAFH